MTNPDLFTSQIESGLPPLHNLDEGAPESTREDTHEGESGHTRYDLSIP